jgi:acetyltransferase-like isoleucine patch superfamily enzyme
METLHVILPDYTPFERELGLRTPFARWNLVDGPPWPHWLDLAHESDIDRVVFEVPVGLAAGPEDFPLPERWHVRVEWAVRSRLAPNGLSVVRYESLYGEPSPGGFRDAWEMIDGHYLAAMNRLGYLWECRVAEFPGSMIGSRTRVHPSAKLVAPYWIGSDCAIGAGAVVGPGSVIADGCVIGAGARLEATCVGPGHVVGEGTSFPGYHLWDGVALNRRRRLSGLDLDPVLLREREPKLLDT